MPKIYIMEKASGVVSFKEVELFNNFTFDFSMMVTEGATYKDHQILPKLFLMRYLGKNSGVFKFIDSTKRQKLLGVVFNEISKLMHARSFDPSRYRKVISDLEDIFNITIVKEIIDPKSSKEIIDKLVAKHSTSKKVTKIAIKNMLLATQLRIDFEGKAIMKFATGVHVLDPLKYGLNESVSIKNLISGDYDAYWTQYSNVINSISHSGDSHVGKLIVINEQMIDEARTALLSLS